MSLAHEQLAGLDRDRILAAVEPVLRAHNVDGVELLWRTDRGGRVLELTVERAGSRVPGEGITIDVCSEISRDLSAALDVADVIPGKYRLEVGSPGLERTLYNAGDYERFAGQTVRLKLHEAMEGQHVIRGVLHGVDEQGRILLETERGEVTLDYSAIHHARLIFDWRTSAESSVGGGKRGGRRPARRGRASRRSHRNR